MRHSVSLFFLWITLAAGVARAQSGTSADFDRLVRAPALTDVAWGAVLMRVGDGAVLASYQADLPLVPASAIKVAVTYPAWKVLGPDYRYSTTLSYDGHIHDSILHGNLYLTGSGDPSFGSSRFPGTGPDSVWEYFYGSLHQSGIKEVEGGLVADAGVFDDQPVPDTWIWEDIGNYYGAGVYGLNYNENLYTVAFRTGPGPGEEARVTGLDPPLQGITIENRVTAGPAGSGDGVVIYGGPYDYRRTFTGTVPAGRERFTVRGSLPDPPLTAVARFQDYLVHRGIRLGHEATTVRALRQRGIRISQGRTLLATVESPTLSELVRATHHKSINLYAEALLKTLGKKSDGSASFKSGIDAVMQFWREAGVSLGGIQIRDGSGLSPSGRVTARQLASMVRTAVLDPAASGYILTLDQAGQPGELKDLFRDFPGSGQLRAKSGYMKTVRTLAGTCRGPGGEALAFAVMINHDGSDNSAIRLLVREIVEVFCRMDE